MELCPLQTTTSPAPVALASVDWHSTASTTARPLRAGRDAGLTARSWIRQGPSVRICRGPLSISSSSASGGCTTQGWRIADGRDRSDGSSDRTLAPPDGGATDAPRSVRTASPPTHGNVPSARLAPRGGPLRSKMSTVGRPRALSLEALERVLTLHHGGLGYRSIARQLREAGVDVNWATIRRAVKRTGAYGTRVDTARDPLAQLALPTGLGLSRGP